MKNDKEFDYGAVSSLRTWVSTARYGLYFQKLDHQMIIKVVEKQIIEGITLFLEEHNIDTSDIREQQEVILNEGVLLQGGSLRAGVVAVGSGAKASVEQA